MFRATDPGVPADDDLLAGLGQDRHAAGPDLAATIRAAQDEVVHTPLDRLLIIQGGPGTGKTITALRRVAWLLDEGLLDDAETLVVGPSAAFARYSEDVLTGWGYDRVEHCSVGALLPAVASTAEEAPHVTRLKGEARMTGLLSRALEERRGRPDGELPSEIDVDGRVVELDPVALRRVIDTARASEATPGDRRIILRATLAAASRDPRLVLEAADRLAERLWPSLDPEGFLRDLFGSRELLAVAAGGEFTEREVAALYRPADEGVWSEADRALLDEAAHLVDGDPKGFGHVVVDQAQDLSPMQLRAIARRSATGSMTVVGDIAQSTGPWARDDWHDLIAQLPSGPPHEHRELRFGYRVPRQIFDLAAELLPMAAPSVQAPTTVRDGAADPVIVPSDAGDRASLVAAAAAGHAEHGRSVAVICPSRLRAEVEAALDAERLPWHPAGDDRPGAGVALLAPYEAKGLEFDAAVVVEPGLILDEDSRGHRLLYIALTRATAHLHLIGAAEDLPIETAPVAEVAAPAELPPVEVDQATRETIDIVVREMAETLLSNLTPGLWPVAMRRLEDLINPEG